MAKKPTYNELEKRIEELEQRIHDLQNPEKNNHFLSNHKGSHLTEDEFFYQKNVLEAIEQSVIITRPDGQIIYWNTFAEKLYGWKSEEVIGKSILDITPSEISKDQAIDIMETLNTGKSWSGEFNVQHRDGTIFTVSVIDTPIFDDNKELVAIIGISMDITGRKQVEEKSLSAKRDAEENEEKYRLLHESAGLGIGYYSPDGVVISYNTIAAHNMGGKPEDFKGKSIFDLFPKEAGDRYYSRLQKAINTDKVTEYEDSVQLPNKYMWFLSTYTKIVNSQNELIGVQIISQDITEIKKIEKNLKISEKRFRALFEQTGDYCMILDPNTDDGIPIIVDANKAAYTRHGYNRDEFIGRPVADIDDEAGKKLVVERTRQIMTGKPFHVENIHIQKDGTPFHVSVHANRIDIEGESPLIFTSEYDITRRKQAEEELKLSEEKFRGIFEQSPIAIEVYNSDGRLIDVNHKTLDMFGISDNKYVLGFNLWEDPNLSMEKIELLKNGQPIYLTTDFDFDIVKDNNLYPTTRSGKMYMDMYAIPIIQGKEISGFLVQILEVTERKQIFQELEKRNKYIETIMDNMPIGFAVNTIDDGDVKYMNNRFEDIYGWSRKTLTNTSLFFDKVFPDQKYRERMKSQIISDMQSGDPDRMRWDNLRITTSKGEERYVFAINIPIADQNLMISTVQDITQRVKALEENEKTKGKLQQAQKMEAIGTLAGGIAHDFNNILTIILGFTTIAISNIPPGSDIKDDLDEVLSATNRAKELVKQILDFSRQNKTERINLKLQPLIKEALKLLRSSIPSTISIIEDIDPITKSISADPTQIHQIIVNLCTNAYHSMEKTGGVLNVSLKSTIIESDDKNISTSLNPGEYLRLKVSDTGEGISPEIINRIFDPYFTTKEMGKGTGMGLSIIHGIVNKYGGTITVESQLGIGSTFCVYFPVVSETSDLKIIDQSELPKGNERILFIDDESLLLKMGEKMLERMGYQVTALSNSIEALATFQDNPNEFDLIITDQTMPDLTGSDLSKKMMLIRPDIPIILATGYSNMINEESALEMGIKAFTLKPFSQREIGKLIRNVLDEKV